MAKTTPASLLTIFASLLLSGCNPSLHSYLIVGTAMLPLLSSGDRVFVDESAGERAPIFMTATLLPCAAAIPL